MVADLDDSKFTSAVLADLIGFTDGLVGGHDDLLANPVSIEKQRSQDLNSL